MQTPTLLTEYRNIDARLVFEDKKQPRKIFDESSLNELAADIKERGIIQPIVIREDIDRKVLSPKELQKEVCFSIVCGARRFRAAMIAGLNYVPCIIRDLTDDEALEFQISENLNRENVNPMDESDAFQQLVKRGIKTPEMIADKFGVSTKYVYDRLTMQRVIPEVQDAVRNYKLTITHAKQFARLPLEDQRQVLKEVDIEDENLKVSDIREEISDMFKLKLSKAIFDTTNAKLVPSAGACEKCKKRTGCNLLLFDEVAIEDVCLDGTCWDTKVAAHIKIVIETNKAAGKEVKLISSQWSSKVDSLLSQNQWTETDEPSNTVGIFMEVSQYSSYQAGQVINIEDIEEQEDQEGKEAQVNNKSGSKSHKDHIDYSEMFAKKCVEKILVLYVSGGGFPTIEARVIIQNAIAKKFNTLNTSTCNLIFYCLPIYKIDDTHDANSHINTPALNNYMSEMNEGDLGKLFMLVDRVAAAEEFEYHPEQSEIEDMNKVFDSSGIDFLQVAAEIGSPTPLFTPTEDSSESKVD